jgi:hypothetical protein
MQRQSKLGLNFCPSVVGKMCCKWAISGGDNYEKKEYIWSMIMGRPCIPTSTEEPVTYTPYG